MITKPLIQGTPLMYPDVVGIKYWGRLSPILNAMFLETEQEVKALFDGPQATKAGLPTQDAGISETARTLFYRLFNKWTRILNRDLTGIVLDMMSEANKASKINLAHSMRNMADSVTVSTDFLKTGLIAEQFKALTIDNVGLFKTIAAKHFEKVEGAVMDSIISGNGLYDLNQFFEHYTTGEKNYAKNRAMDQTRKAYTSIAKARMESTGIKKFKWLHSHGSNAPRKLHEELNGKIFAFDDPPYIGNMYNQMIYGFPGQLPNCRCMMIPVFDFELEQAA